MAQSAISIKTSGFRELEKKLGEIAKPATRKTVAIRALTAAAEPMAKLIASLAPVDMGDLRDAIAVAPRAVKGGGGKGKRGGGGGEFGDTVEVFVGVDTAAIAKNPELNAYAGVQEFGPELYDVSAPAQPYFRPGFERDKVPALGRIAKSVEAEIGKTLTRQSKRAG